MCKFLVNDNLLNVYYAFVFIHISKNINELGRFVNVSKVFVAQKESLDQLIYSVEQPIGLNSVLQLLCICIYNQTRNMSISSYEKTSCYFISMFKPLIVIIAKAKVLNCKYGLMLPHLKYLSIPYSEMSWYQSRFVSKYKYSLCNKIKKTLK